MTQIYYHRNSDELRHHGILGMKWGIRRYQNKDGTLTAAGKKRYDKISSNEKMQAKQTKQAREMYSKNLKDNERLAKSYTKTSNRLMDRHNKLMDEYNQLKDLGYTDSNLKAKADKSYGNAKRMQLKAEPYIENSNVLKKKIADLDSGKIKAGKDFIVQNDYYLDMPLIAVPVFTAGYPVYKNNKNYSKNNVDSRSDMAFVPSVFVGSSRKERKVIYK